MKIHFRQGIVRYQTDINAQPVFLQKSTLDSQFLDLIVSPDPTIITFAHRSANYVFEEARTVTRAWGPFTTAQTQYLYWDINVLTAELARGATLLPPIYSAVSPSNPANDQHWFDTGSTTMFVYQAARQVWVEKIRVFAATYSSSAIIKALPLGSQAGLNTPIDAGNIVLDGFNKPLRQSDGSFLTSAVAMSVIGLATKKIKVENEILQLLAKEYIAQFNCVQARAGRTCVLAKSTDRFTRVIGVVTEDINQGEIGTVVSQGLIRSDSFAWPADKVNRPVFCGPFGQLTTTPPIIGVLQQVGTIYDVDAVYINIYPSITLDHPDGIFTPPPPPPPGVPQVAFSASPNVRFGPAPFTVNFIDASTGGPFLSQEWDFTNDGTVDSTLPAPSYTYTTPGTYSVRHTVTNSSGTGSFVEENFIVVQQPVQQPGFTNLEVRFVINGVQDTGQPIRVQRGTTFEVKLQVRNDGLITATNVQRVFIVHDVRGQQVTVTTPPVGATVARGAGFTQIIFAPISSMVSGSAIDYPPFTLLTPNIRQPIRMEAAVSSPEIDVELSDNNRALTLEVTP